MDLGSAWRRVELVVQRWRNRSGLFDHVMATLGHYGRVNGNGEAGAVTYFAFLAFFPLMALLFFVIGLIANVYPEARQNLADAINTLLSGLIGDGPGQVSLQVFQDNAGTAGLIGLIGFLYAGLGWMSSMRNALQTLFAKPSRERPNFFFGKARDLMTLLVVGLMMLASIAITSTVTRYSAEIIEGVGLDPTATLPKLVLRVFGALVAVLLTTSMLMVLYQLLARPHVSHRALREGAVLAALGFELLKLLADKLIELTHGQPAFTVFGFGLVLLVLINYFSRVVMYGAAWAFMSQRPADLNPDQPTSPHWRPPTSD